MEPVLVINDLQDVDDVGLEYHACHDDLVQYVVHLEGKGEGGRIRSLFARMGYMMGGGNKEKRHTRIMSPPSIPQSHVPCRCGK
jgi:hypothetical protein